MSEENIDYEARGLEANARAAELGREVLRLRAALSLRDNVPSDVLADALKVCSFHPDSPEAQRVLEWNDISRIR